MEHVIISFNGLIITVCSYLCTGIYNYVPEKTVFLRYIVLQIFCSYNLWYINCAKCFVLLHQCFHN